MKRFDFEKYTKIISILIFIALIFSSVAAITKLQMLIYVTLALWFVAGIVHFVCSCIVKKNDEYFANIIVKIIGCFKERKKNKDE